MKIYWYFEALDKPSDLMITGFGGRVEKCPRSEVLTRQGRKGKADLFRAGEGAAASIFASRDFDKLSFRLYKQENDGDAVGDIVERQTYKARMLDPFREARRFRKGRVRKGVH